MLAGTKMFVDSNISPAQAIRANPAQGYCPKHVLSQQCLLTVHYWGFDAQLHRGQIVVHQDVTTDIHDFFELAEHIRFPFAGVVPLAHPDYLWDRDKTVLQGNLTYGFNWRTVHGATVLSRHAQGLAIDVNPLQNPYQAAGDGAHVLWPPTRYNPLAPGSLRVDSPLVVLMESRGWAWGGNQYGTSGGATDYMHFEKRR